MSFFDTEGRELIACASEVREMDRRAIEELGIPGRVLMELAGSGTAHQIDACVGRAQGRAVILCGPGGNGGDGYVIARHLEDRGWTVRCISIVVASELSGDTLANRQLWDSLGGETLTLQDKPTARMKHHLGHANVIVDGLFGTGQRRPVSAAVAELLTWANDTTHGTRVALDLPTGIAADTGALLGPAFNAALTTTYGIAKPGLYQSEGASLSGEVVVVPVGLPRMIVDAVGASSRRLTGSSVSRLLPHRPKDGHKGTFGHVGVVGGASGMEGASLLAARGALRTGVGLVTWNMPRGVQRDLGTPEVMTHDATEGLDDRSGVLVVGPGLNTDAEAARLLDMALECERPVVLDADALTLIAQGGRLLPEGSILTPHPGEAARLLGVTPAEVQSDRPSAARRIAERYCSTVVLKGAGTLIASPGEPSCILDVASPALAVAGSGDVLAGIIAGLRAQGLTDVAAAHAGVWLHGNAGLELAEAGAELGLLASEIADAVPGLFARLNPSSDLASL